VTRLWVVVIAACVPVSATAPETPAPPPAAIIPIRAAVIPTLAYPVIDELPSHDDGPILVTVGSLRAAVTRTDTRFAGERFAEPIIGATRTPTGWLFVSSDGLVARSEHFLGPLTVLGTVPPQPPSKQLPRSCGRIAVVTREGRVLTTDGTTPVTELTGTPPGRVERAAFVDPDHGMVIDANQLFATRDGGRSFQRVDLHVSTVLEVECVDGRFRIDTSSGKRDVEKDGSQVALGPDEGVPYVRDLDKHVAIGALRRYPRLVAETFGGIVADDGRVLIPSHDSLRLVDDVDDLDIKRNRCIVDRWGANLGIACRNGIFEIDPKTGARTIRTDEDIDPRFVAFSDDGDHVGWGCTTRRIRGRLSPDSWCVMTGKTTSEPHISGRVLGMRRGAVVALDQHDVVSLDPTTGKRLDPLGPMPPVDRTDEIALSGDHAIVTGTAKVGGETWLVGVTLATGAAIHERLPAGAVRSGMATAELGIAVGRDRSKLWATRDHGQHWEPVEVAVDGALVDSFERVSRTALIREIRCTPIRCVIDRRVAIAFDGIPLGAAERVVAAPASEPTGPSAPPGDRIDLACDADGPQRGATKLENPDDYLLDAHGRSHYQRANVDLEVVAHGHKIDASWQGSDRLGSYSVRGGGPVARPIDHTGQLHLIVATRDGAVFADVEAGANAWLWLPVGAAPVAIPNDPTIYDALALPDGTLAILEGPMRGNGMRLFVYDKTGKVIAHTDLGELDRSARLGIALVDDIAGVQIDRRFVAATTRELPALDLTALPICKAAGPITSIVPYHEAISTPVPRLQTLRRVYLQKDCIAAIEISDAADGNQVFAVAAAGELRSDVYVRDIYKSLTQPLRCRHRP